MLNAAKSGSPDVRVAALRTLESVGDASTVPFLADTAAIRRPKGPVQDAARRTLGSLKGRASTTPSSRCWGSRRSDAIAVELLKAVADRRIFLAKPAVSAALVGGRRRPCASRA